LKSPKAGVRNGQVKKRVFSLSAGLVDSLHATMAVRQERLGHVDAKTTMGYTHLVTVDDTEVAGKLGALLDKEFIAQDLPKLQPDSKTASGEFTEAV
jgi:hypothetical protein